MAGVVLVTEFSVSQEISSKDEQYSGYLDYIDRESAKDKISNYLDYMDNPQKAISLFTENKDEITPEHKELIKNCFITAQENGSLLWKSVLTFDNEFLSEYGLYDLQTKKLDNKKIMEYTRGCMSSMLKNENLSDSGFWTAAIHYNTDNIHVHIATVEPVPQREKVNRTYLVLSNEWVKQNNIQIPTTSERENVFSEKADKDMKNLYYACKKATKNLGIKFGNSIFTTKEGDIKIAVSQIPVIDTLPTGMRLIQNLEPKGKFKQSSINKGKGYVINQIIQSKETNNYINNIIRKNIIDVKKENSLVKDKDLALKFLNIHSKLPQNRQMWFYNMNAISDIRPLIDELSGAYIEKYHKNDYKELTNTLERQENEYSRAYGEKSPNNMTDNKIKDLYTRLGNTILTELREYDKSLNVNEKENPRSHSRIFNRTSHILENSLRRLKRYLNKDYEHFKNQQVYDQLQREKEQEI